VRARGVWLGIVATVLVASAPLAWSMELRDMPPWLRDMIEPVHVTTTDGDASAETVGVHIWGTQGPIGTPAVAPTGAVSSSEAVAAPATGAVSLSGMDSPAVGGVRAPSAGEAFPSGAVSISPMATEWNSTLASIEALDDETLAQGGQVLAMIREQNMSPEEFAAWVQENHISPQVLTSALLMVGVHRYDNYPTPQPDALVLAAGLEVLAGDGLARIESVPPFGRLWLAIMLGGRGDEAGALTAFDSMSDEQLVALPRETAVMSIAHLIDEVPRAAVPAIKRYAAATDQRAAWAADVAAACKRVGGSRIIRDELIPYSEAVLGAMPPTESWDRALDVLMWGYMFTGDTDSVMSSADRWFSRLDELGVNTWTPLGGVCRVYWASALARSGNPQAAGRMLMRVLARANEEGWELRNEVAMELAGLAEAYPEVSLLPGLPMSLDGCDPDNAAVAVQVGGRATRSIVVRGGAALRLLSGTCDLPFVEVELSDRWWREGGSRQRIDLALTGDAAPGDYVGQVVVRTNSHETPVLRVPLAIVVEDDLVIRPATVFFGFVKAGEERASAVRLTRAAPFIVEKVEVDEPALVTVDAESSTGGRCWLLRARIRLDRGELGPVEGTMTVYTDIDGISVHRIPYYAHLTH